MRSVTKLIAISILCFGAVHNGYAQTLRDRQLKEYAKQNGFVRAEAILPSIDERKSAAGRLLFESKKLSLGEDTSCSNCHLSRFGSADGLPDGIGLDDVVFNCAKMLEAQPRAHDQDEDQGDGVPGGWGLQGCGVHAGLSASGLGYVGGRNARNDSIEAWCASRSVRRAAGIRVGGACVRARPRVRDQVLRALLGVGGEDTAEAYAC